MSVKVRHPSATLLTLQSRVVDNSPLSNDRVHDMVLIGQIVPDPLWFDLSGHICFNLNFRRNFGHPHRYRPHLIPAKADTVDHAAG